MRNFLKNRYVSFSFAVFMVMLAGVVISLGVTVFISPNGFLSTGVTGIALIVGRLFDAININFNPDAAKFETQIASVLYFIFNIPILILSWKKLSRKFTILSFVNIITVSITMYLFPSDIAERLHLSVRAGNISYLDAAIFVGAMNGSVNGIAFIVGGSAGGTDILSMYYSLKRQTSIGKMTILLNVFIVSAGIILEYATGDGNPLALAFYTLIYVVVNSIVIDLFYVRNRRTVLFITTSKGDKIASLITHDFVRGVTELDAKGAYTGEHKDFLYCACSSFEVVEMMRRIKQIDEHAFVTVIEASKIHGNFINKEMR